MRVAVDGLAIVGACALCFSAAVSSAALLYSLGRRARGLLRRDGGAPNQAASPVLRVVDVSTTSATQNSVVYFSSRREPGGASGVLAILPTPPRPSNTGARGFSGTAASVGTSPGQRHGLAG